MTKKYKVYDTKMCLKLILILDILVGYFVRFDQNVDDYALL